MAEDTIQWTALSTWFQYNDYEDTTSFPYTKDASWKIKVSTNNLPILDILNRNYPKIIKDRTTCLLCSVGTETNEHIWQCLALLPHIKQAFTAWSVKLENILTNYGDALYQQSHIIFKLQKLFHGYTLLQIMHIQHQKHCHFYVRILLMIYIIFFTHILNISKC